MAEYMHLVGTEQVQSAANSMKHSAEQVTQAANIIDTALRQFLMTFVELVGRLEEVAWKEEDSNAGL